MIALFDASEIARRSARTIVANATRERPAMSAPSASTSPDWYWSQRGVTMGPVTFEELRRLLGDGSIAADTWIYHPLQSAWVQVSAVPELMDAVPRPAIAPPPDAAAAGVLYCRFCGAPSAPTALHCAACGRPHGTNPNFALDAKTVAIICRASIAATAVLPVVAAAIPAVLWAVNPSDQHTVREAKASLNCHITIVVAWAAAILISLLGLLLIIGPVIGALIIAATYIYGLVVGILGVIAAAQDKPFAYPATLRLIP